MLSNVSFFLVSVDMPVSAKLDDALGLSLRFSCEILTNSTPCLITITVEGRCSEQLCVSVKMQQQTGLNLGSNKVTFCHFLLLIHPLSLHQDQLQHLLQFCEVS